MKISFYLNDNPTTEITIFRELSTTPFKVGDKVSLSVTDIKKSTLHSYTDNYRTKVTNENELISEKFDLKDVIIKREEKYISFNILSEPTLTIDYYCKLIN